MKICPTCKKGLPATRDYFYPRKTNRDNLYSECKECSNKKTKEQYKKHRRKRLAYAREYNLEHPNINRQSKLQNKYGLSIDKYNQMFINQLGCCFICGTHSSKFKRRLAVDHDHETGEVRGLLCPRCNKNLGVLEGWALTYQEKILLYLQGPMKRENHES